MTQKKKSIFNRNFLSAARNIISRFLFGPIIAFVVRRFGPYLRYEAFMDAVGDDVISWRPDIVHAHDLHTLPAGVDIARQVDAHLIYDSHELETHRQPPPPLRRQRFIERLERRAIAAADGVITVSDAIADYLASLYEIERPSVVRNAPEIAEDAEDREEDDIRSRLALANDVKLIVYVGYVTFNRGVDVVLRALGDLPGVVFAAVGPQRPETAEELLTLAAELGVADRFHLIPPVPPHTVVDFIKTANVGVIPIIPVTLSYEYAMPNKLFEMAFAGLPIVASRLTEITRFVETYELGETFVPGDTAGCAEALRKRLLLGADGRPPVANVQRLRREYVWTAQCAVLETLYRKIGSTSADRPVSRSKARVTADGKPIYSKGIS